jgi:hypothetical protein
MGHMIQVPYGHTMVNRMAPDAGPEYFKTYTCTAPLKTHWRRATCEEYECDGLKYGFVVTIDFSTDLGQRQLYYLTKIDKDRRHHMQRTGPQEVKLIYGPGNPCMNRADHRVPVGRPPYYLVADGDFRGNPRRTQPYHHRRAEDWIEDFSLHQREIADTRQRG